MPKEAPGSGPPTRNTMDFGTVRSHQISYRSSRGSNLDRNNPSTVQTSNLCHRTANVVVVTSFRDLRERSNGTDGAETAKSAVAELSHAGSKQKRPAKHKASKFAACPPSAATNPAAATNCPIQFRLPAILLRLVGLTIMLPLSTKDLAPEEACATSISTLPSATNINPITAGADGQDADEKEQKMRETRVRSTIRCVVLWLFPLISLVLQLPYWRTGAILSIISSGSRHVRPCRTSGWMPFALLALTTYAFQMLLFSWSFDQEHPDRLSPHHALSDSLRSHMRGAVDGGYVGGRRADVGDNLLGRRKGTHRVDAESLEALPRRMLAMWERDVLPASHPDAVKTTEDETFGVSIVIPAHAEHEYIQRTLESILNETAAIALSDILVVDDANEIPISDAIEPATLQNPKVKIMRSEQRLGLVNSKHKGGYATKGSYLIFLDAHVKPQRYWLQRLLREMNSNPKRVVVPAIPILEKDSWEVRSSAVGYKMMFSWNLNFNWFEDANDEVPCMSGGLVALTRDWWEHTGGFDTGMELWGSENIEQSIRTWLSGGEIVVARESRVSHVFRPNFPYNVDSRKVNINKVRTIDVWFDRWKEEVYKSSPYLRRYGQAGKINVTEAFERRRRLTDKDFDWYVRRFRNVFLSRHMMPLTSFKLRASDDSSRCLGTTAALSDELHDAELVMMPCSNSGESENEFDYNSEQVAAINGTDSLGMQVKRNKPMSPEVVSPDAQQQLFTIWGDWLEDEPLTMVEGQLPPDYDPEHTVISFNHKYKRASAAGPRVMPTLRNFEYDLCLAQKGYARESVLPHNIGDPAMFHKCKVEQKDFRWPALTQGFFFEPGLGYEHMIAMETDVQLAEQIPQFSRPVAIRWGSICLTRSPVDDLGATSSVVLGLCTEISNGAANPNQLWYITDLDLRRPAKVKST